MSKHKNIYMITTIHCKDDEIKSYEDFGWYRSKKWAERAVLNNALGMDDCAFNYAVIKEFPEGGYGYIYSDKKWFYKFNADTQLFEFLDFVPTFLSKMFSKYL